MNCTAHERSKHTSENGIYTKDQLLKYLKHVCPKGLAIFLAHDDFEIKKHTPGRFALRVGYTTTITTGEIENELWLTKINPKTTGESKDLHYYTLEDGDSDKYVNGAQVFKGTGVFSNLAKSGRVSGFAFITKALF